MATYILLLTLTPEGRERALENPQGLLEAEKAISVPGVQTLGLYGVLGPYDFVSIVEAPDNETVGRFSIEFGVAVGVHITTLPAIPVSRLDSSFRLPALAVELDLPRELGTQEPSGEGATGPPL